ncbi:MAG: DUF6265 family protein [Acidobacteriota bacterium]
MADTMKPSARKPSARFLMLSLVTAVLALASLASTPALAQGPSTDDFAWIVGSWGGDMGDGSIEETWMPPLNGTLIGMFRWSAADEIRLYEFMSIEDTDKGPVLFLRHFSPGLKAWEEKDSPMRYDLDAFDPDRFSFVNVTDGQTTRLTYTKTDAGMQVVLDQIKGAEKSSMAFDYKAR